MDFQKAFNTLEHNKIPEALKECRIDYRYTRIHNIYRQATTTVKLHTNSKHIKIDCGVRQGDPMSPKLFNTVLEYAFKTLEWHNKGIKIDGEYLNNLRFADDIVVTADDLGKAREMIMELQVAIEKVDINMNTDKTKMMT